MKVREWTGHLLWVLFSGIVTAALWKTSKFGAITLGSLLGLSRILGSWFADQLSGKFSNFLYSGSSHSLSPEEALHAEEQFQKLEPWLEAAKILLLCLALLAWAYLPGCVRDIMALTGDTVVPDELLIRLLITGFGGLVWLLYLVGVVGGWLRR